MCALLIYGLFIVIFYLSIFVVIIFCCIVLYKYRNRTKKPYINGDINTVYCICILCMYTMYMDNIRL